MITNLEPERDNYDFPELHSFAIKYGLSHTLSYLNYYNNDTIFELKIHWAVCALIAITPNSKTGVKWSDINFSGLLRQLIEA